MALLNYEPAAPQDSASKGAVGASPRESNYRALCKRIFSRKRNSCYGDRNSENKVSGTIVTMIYASFVYDRFDSSVIHCPDFKAVNHESIKLSPVKYHAQKIARFVPHHRVCVLSLLWFKASGDKRCDLQHALS